ncbi:hypothetical protein ABEF93_001073 [Exophiala dermatitidis]
MDIDIDISDILAEVSRPTNANSQSQPSYSDTDAFTDHQLLTRAWTSERCAPELLPYPSDLLDRVMARSQAQITKIEDLASSGGEGLTAPSLAANNYGGRSRNVTSSTPQNTNLVLSILQTDLSRTQFLVRGFLRQRLHKITKHAGWYLAQLEQAESGAESGGGGYGYLSRAEAQFLRAHQALLSDFYGASFLNAFPQALRRLDDSTGGVPMVEPPDADTAVVVRCLSSEGRGRDEGEGVWSNEPDLDDMSQGVSDQDKRGGGATVELRMRRGEVWVVRWRDVRGGVERGELELL